MATDTKTEQLVDPVDGPVAMEATPEAPNIADVYEHRCDRKELSKIADQKWPDNIHSWVHTQQLPNLVRRKMQVVTLKDMGMDAKSTEPVRNRNSVLVRQNRAEFAQERVAREARSIRNMQRTMTEQEAGHEFAKINIHKKAKRKTLADMQR